MLCFRRLNVQVIFTVLLDTEKQQQQQQISGTTLPSPPCPGGKQLSSNSPSAPWLPKSTLAALLCGREKLTLCQGEHSSSSPAPCLLGISQASTGGLGAVMLLNTAISKCELKRIKSALRRGVFWGGVGFFVCFPFFLTSGKASKENSKAAVSKLAAPQAKQPNLRVHCSLPATSDYLLQSNKSFPP